MGNIIDYLDWRGDIPFDVDPFNEVDNLILSELAYIDFGGIVTDSFDQKVSIGEACEKFFSMHTDEEIMDSVMNIKVTPYIMPHMVDSARYKDLKLYGYVDEISNEDQIQFSVVTFDLPDDSVYVAFRGTDNSLIGWKEDFNMSFLYETPGQKSAAVYLSRHFADETRLIRVGGHSKGGNFAVFASAFCEKKVQDKIIAVYSNDGPGFRQEVLKAPGYKKILPRVISTLPKQSIVGVLLGSNDLHHRFVQSANKGLMQHDGLSWQVLRNHFVFAEGQGDDSLVMEESWKLWLEGLDGEQRKRFTDLLFDSMMASGANTTDEIVKNGLKVLGEGIKTIKSATPEDKKLFKEVFLRLANSIGISTKEVVETKIRAKGPEPLKNLLAKTEDA